MADIDSIPTVGYAVITTREWPVSLVEEERFIQGVWERRRRSGNVTDDRDIHVFAFDITNVREVEYVKPHTIPAQLREKQQ